MTLVVFFSRGVSLGTWCRSGLLARELTLLGGLAREVDRIALVTYGGTDDERYVRGAGPFDVLCNKYRLPGNVYSVLAPLLHRRAIATASVLRTNQINGAWAAVLAKRLFGIPLIVRCGFSWADNVERLPGAALRRRVARALERWIFRAADVSLLPTRAHLERVATAYGVDTARLRICPNYVDTEAFSPVPGQPREANHVLYVGRLSPEKRVETLIGAVATLPGLSVTIVGDGPERQALESLARRHGVDARFAGSLPHAQLPVLMQKASVLVLPSAFEGAPKVIAEAMACGLPVIGTNVPGIRDAIRDGDTGTLCGTAVPEVAAAIARVLRDPPRAADMASKALAEVRAHASLEAAWQIECEAIREIVNEVR